MQINKAIGLFVLAVLIIFGLSSAFVVTEGQQGLLLWLGQIEKNPKTQQPIVLHPGLHFKVPFFNSIKLFDSRLQTLDIKSSRIVTANKKDVLVDYYIKWRISNLPLFFTRTGGNMPRAEVLLEQQLNDSLRAEFGRRTIAEVVAEDRNRIMAALLLQANKNAQTLGADVIDVRIKRIDLPQEVSTAVFERMRAERERVATEHRAQGHAKAEEIRATADKNVTIMLAKANRQAMEIRAAGDAEAAKIYADAYQQDPSFYSFYRSQLAYQKVFANQQSIIVLSPNSQFFKFFNTIDGKPKE